MKKVTGLFLIVAALLFNDFAVMAQTVKRIQFAKGKTSTIVRGNTGSGGVYYNLRVKGGEKMALDLSPAATVGIKVETDSGAEVLLREARGGFYELYFENDREISIFVGSTGRKSAAFALRVKITRMTDI